MATLLLPGRVILRLHHSWPRSKIRATDNLISLTQGLRTRSMSELSSSSMSQPIGDSKNEDGKGERTEEVVVQYVVLRRDLIDEWPLGSVVTQGCHASVAAIWENKEDAHTLEYCSPQKIDSMHKVTVEVKGETQMLNLAEKLRAAGIAHKLWIEQPENFPTCLATKPYPKSMLVPFFKKLKLCR